MRRHRPFILTAILILLLVFSASAMAVSVTFEWNPNPPEEKVTGYKIHIGKVSKTYTVIHDAGNVIKTTVPGMEDGVYFASATAYDAAGNVSPYSDEIQFTIDTTAPTGVKSFKFSSVARE